MQFKPIECRLPGLTLSGIECGSGPVALFLHGLGANAHVFEPLMTALAVRFRCISFDQRGHGLSGRPAEGYAAADFASDVGLAISTLADGRALVIGHSLGARNALAAGVSMASVMGTWVTQDVVSNAFAKRIAPAARQDVGMVTIATSQSIAPWLVPTRTSVPSCSISVTTQLSVTFRPAPGWTRSATRRSRSGFGSHSTSASPAWSPATRRRAFSTRT